MDMDDLQAKKHLRPRPHTSYNITIGEYVGSDLITLVFWSHFIVWTMYILYIYIFLSVFVAMFSGAVLALEDLSPKPSALVFFSKYMDNFFGTATWLFCFFNKSCKYFDRLFQYKNVKCYEKIISIDWQNLLSFIN